MSKWERGYSLPDVTLVAEICRLLKVRADFLLGMEEVLFCENENTVVERAIRQNLIAEPLRIEVGVALIETFPNPQQSWGESCTQVAIN